MLYLEAMGTFRISPVEETGYRKVVSLEYSEVCTWPLAFKWESGVKICSTETVLLVGRYTGTC